MNQRNRRIKKKQSKTTSKQNSQTPNQKGRTPGFDMNSFNFDQNPSWRIFRIMAEFVDGFHFISKFRKTVTFFGSARFDEENLYYQKSRRLASLLSDSGYTVVSGGGPGIMEAANRGAVEVGGESVGLNIQLPSEQRINKYVNKPMAFNYFFTRKVMLAFSAQAYIFFPGGYGTLDETFELITLRQTHKINPRIPIILIGSDYWQPLCDWLKNVVYAKHRAITVSELKLWEIVDTPEQALKIIKNIKL